mmetsp:Transcript_76003/g.214941  ORF Transcript_76003/g.214941 Transcript_76003/m.214941 type:complete len:218 (+) Transcript_76003:783-1436(+)
MDHSPSSGTTDIGTPALKTLPSSSATRGGWGRSGSDAPLSSAPSATRPSTQPMPGCDSGDGSDAGCSGFAGRSLLGVTGVSATCWAPSCPCRCHCCGWGCSLGRCGSSSRCCGCSCGGGADCGCCGGTCCCGCCGCDACCGACCDTCGEACCGDVDAGCCAAGAGCGAECCMSCCTVGCGCCGCGICACTCACCGRTCHCAWGGGCHCCCGCHGCDG